MFIKEIRTRALVTVYLLGLAVALGFFLVNTGLESQAETAYSRENLLRLHIIPHSNNPQDQDLKIKVRNAVMAVANEIFDGVATQEQAKAYIEENWDYIQRTALQTVEAEGFDYPVRLELGTFDFPDRDYHDFTLPAGDYQALRIVIGEGSGNNWWCVLFPPLCLSSLDEHDERARLVSEASHLEAGSVEFRLKFMENVNLGKVEDFWQASLEIASNLTLPLLRGK